MKKWYQSGLAKGVWICILHFCAVAGVLSLVWLFLYPSAVRDVLNRHVADSYTDSSAFASDFYVDTSTILNGISSKSDIEKDGKIDTERIVDLDTYVNKGTISGKNESGLSYKLGDLLKWSESATYEVYEGYYETAYESAGTSDPIIVCQKPDGTYAYYYYSDFAKKVNDKELQFVFSDNYESVNTASILNDLKNRNYYSGEFQNYASGIQDKEGELQFVDCWNYTDLRVSESYAPVDAKSILDIVNENDTWNGRLTEAFQLLDSTLSSMSNANHLYHALSDDWAAGNTNLRYVCIDNTKKTLYTNIEGIKSYKEDAQKGVNLVTTLGKYVVVSPSLKGFESNLPDTTPSEWTEMVKNLLSDSEDYTFAIGLDEQYPVQDSFYLNSIQFENSYQKTPPMLILLIFSILAFLVGFIWLTVVAGRTPGDNEIHLNWFDKWKTEVAAIIIFCAWFFPAGLGISITNSTMSYQISGSGHYQPYSASMNTEWIVIAFIMFFTCAMFLIGYLSLVRRIKARTLWKNSLLRMLCCFIARAFRNRKFVWRVSLAFVGFLLLHWIGLGSGYGLFVILMFAADIAAFIFLIHDALGKQKIKDGIERIASGELDYQIPLERLKGEQLLIARRINTIGEGLEAAMNESMKSERLKTDLITNVSHDIKTPLTSIINYIDLLRKENFEDPKIQHYLDVLEEKAQRLKILTEDVVEASKVSSGNINLERMNINLVEMIQQTSGEFAERFAAKELQEVLTLPKQDAIIFVDGKRMWRVLENIYNNAAKYALQGTRIYGDLQVTKNDVLFSLKNVSEQPLNISAEELTERFIRGDVSRSTEGSGLGLSIARDLTQMQGGQFDLYLDGDLFKVTITFPRVEKNQDSDIESRDNSTSDNNAEDASYRLVE